MVAIGFSLTQRALEVSRQPRRGDRESMPRVSDFLVMRKDLRETRIDESAEPEIGAGQALLRVDTFGLTANNITYGGFGEVERSEADEVAEGTRVYGYLPPSSYLAVEPADADERGFVDGAAHRAS